MFSIKLKTKNGNAVSKKQVITVFFRLHYKKGLRTTAEYTYRIIYGSNKVHDPGRVFSLKDQKSIKSLEDFTLKVMLNFCHIIANITQAENIDPDFIMFISPDMESKNKSWMFLNDIFRKAKENEDGVKVVPANFEDLWDKLRCDKLGINMGELDLLREFVEVNTNTKFMNVDPNRDPKKYAKSIQICAHLQDRIDRKPEIFKED